MKYWVVTGASRGIGLELAHQILTGGDQVTAIVRNPAKSDGLNKLSKEFGSKIKIIQADVSREEDLVRAAKELGGNAIDVLINNAGIYLRETVKLSGLDLKTVEQTFSVNAVGPMRSTKAFLPLLKKAAHPVIANMTSQMGSIGDNTSGGSYAYRMSKAALNMFTMSLAHELPEATVLSLHPGWVKTDMGGSGAPTEARESAAGLLKVIRGASSKDSGKFLNFRGQRIEW